MSSKMAELEKMLAADEALAAKYEEALKAADAEGTLSLSEGIARAAAAVGYKISADEVEAESAELQKLSEDDLNAVAGGAFWLDEDDEHGHEASCAVAWHCNVVLLHTETQSTKVKCLQNYVKLEYDGGSWY